MSRAARHRPRAVQWKFWHRAAAALRALRDVATGRPRRGPAGYREHVHGAPEHAGSRLVRQKVGLAQAAGVALLAIALVWIGWRIVADTAAQALAVDAPQRAIAWSADEAAALDQLARNELARPAPDLDAIKRWAERSLRANPLDDQALFFLGFVAARNNDNARADALAKLVGARSWRTFPTQLWLFERAFRRGDFAEALPHADALLRTNYLDAEFTGAMFPALAAFTREGAAFAALSEFLASDPPWRSWYLRNLAGNLVDRSRVIALYAALSASKHPPSAEELAPYVQRLVRDGEYAAARQVWRASLPAAQRNEDALLYNGDFSRPLGGLPFNWTVVALPGADASIVADDDGHALRVQFSGARVPGWNVSELLLLPPGRYRLSGRVKAQDLRAIRGLWWRLACTDKPQESLTQTELIAADRPWTGFAADFSVPAQGCAAQWLRLEIPARVGSETQLEGQVWYRDLRIGPLAAEPPPAR